MPQNWDNADPTTTFSSSLGSALYIGDETAIQARANDPDGDEVHLTIVYCAPVPAACQSPALTLMTSLCRGPSDVAPVVARHALFLCR